MAEATIRPELIGSVTYEVNGVELRCVDEGDGPLVVLCHGFPELAFSWRHQVPALVDAGFRVIAPDQRGYGGSSRPEATEAYDIEHLTGDVLALMDLVGAEEAHVVGHDWGSMVVWSLAQRAPERVASVVGMSVPFIPRPPAPPIQTMRAAFGDTFFYMVYFQDPGVAEADLEADVRETMSRFLGGMSQPDADAAARMFAPYGEMGMVERLPRMVSMPDWLTGEELDVYVDAFTAGGFRGPVSWYRNLDRNWELSEHLAETRVGMPALFVTGELDPVNTMMPATGMEEWVTDLRGSHVVPGAGHWVQQERPDDVNRHLVGFLTSL